MLRDNGFAGASTFYPNMVLISEDEAGMVIFYHGHSPSVRDVVRCSTFPLISQAGGILLNAESLERQNASWIDFLLSTYRDDDGLGADFMVAHESQLD